MTTYCHLCDNMLYCVLYCGIGVTCYVHQNHHPILPQISPPIFIHPSPGHSFNSGPSDKMSFWPVLHLQSTCEMPGPWICENIHGPTVGRGVMALYQGVSSCGLTGFGELLWSRGLSVFQSAISGQTSVNMRHFTNQ